MSKTFYDFFSELNRIPRPSHHEERVADYLCRFAEEHHLRYRRDVQNCVVVEKPASPGCENADPIVILNHMDMVCVAKDGYLRNGYPFDPLNDEILPYIETDENGVRWMKAEGTSLGADNGIGLAMALAILADDTLEHPALEVLTTTNEEDGMTGAEALDNTFIRGRKVINLDSEAYDEITVGAAGACLQVGSWKLNYAPLPSGYVARRIFIEGGLGGHSGVDINKGRCNANKMMTSLFTESFMSRNDLSTFTDGLFICSLNGGTANASIASWAEMVIAMPEGLLDEIEHAIKKVWNEILTERFHDTDSHVHLGIEEADDKKYITNFSLPFWTIAHLPFGVVEMREDMPDTVKTSNNIGVIATQDDVMTVSCHTRSFDMEEQRELSNHIRWMMEDSGAEVKMLMDTGSWVERPDSPLLALTCQTFRDVLGFEPKKVAMHFVLEAAYYVEKFPGIEMASIGPRIIEPHSTSERVDLDTADNIWRVTVELLRRLGKC